MSKSLEDRLAQIGDEAEAGEEDQTVKPIPEHEVTRGNPRSKVLQVRLNPDELDALEAIAARRALPVSTIAREHLLKLIADDHSAVEDRLLQLIHAATRVQALADDMREDLLDRLSVIERKGDTPSLKKLIDALGLEPDIR
jgi:hypothetical protein